MKEYDNLHLKNQYLKKTHFLSHFSFPIEDHVKLYRAEKGELIFEDYGTNDKILFLVSGRAKLCHTLENGERTLLAFSKAPELFGEMELFGYGDLTKELRAISRCDLLGFSFLPHKKQLLNDPKFLLFTSICLANKERQKSLDLTRNSCYPLDERFAHHIISTYPDGVISDSLSDTAQYLGAAYRHLLRVVNEFCVKGYLIKKKSDYVVANVQALQALATQVDTGLIGEEIITFTD